MNPIITPLISKLAKFVTVAVLLLSAVISAFAQANTDPAAEAKKQAEEKAVKEARRGIAAAQGALDTASDIIRRVDAAKNMMGSLSARSEPTELTLLNISELNSGLKRLLDEGLTGNVKGAVDKLTTSKSTLTALLINLPEDSQNEEILNARTAVNTRITEVDNQIKAVNDCNTALSGRAVSLYGFVKGVYTNNTARLKPLEDATATETAQALLLILPTRLGDASASINFTKTLDEQWMEMSSRLALLSGLSDAEATTKKDSVDSVANEASTKITTIIGKLQGWFDTLDTHSSTVVDSLNKTLNAVYDDPSQASGAELEVEKAGRLASNLHQISVDWSTLSAVFQKYQFQTVIDYNAIQASADKLDAQSRRLDTRKVLLMDSTAGDMSKFKTEFIQLYYFTDTNNLIRALNPAAFEVRDIAGLREQAAQIRRELDRAGIALTDAQSEVNILQKRLEDLREEKRQADARLFSANGLFTSAEKRLADLRSRPDPQDPGKVKRAEDDLAARQSEKDAAQANSDALNNQQTGLPGQITAAQDRLTSAKADVRRARNNGLLLASAESEAFAAARDNEKIFIAPIIGTTRDPMKRVFLYAFGNRKVIYMRGLESDVNEVKTAIALFDRPAPQARLTLWTLELNSTADNKGAKKFATVLPFIENGLANSRSRISASLSFLRDCITKKVSEVASRELKSVRSGKTDKEVKTARMFFYEKSVLLRFGFDPDAGVNQASSEIVDMMLPDPAGVTTLGEALLVLSLASHVNREAILNEFQKNVVAEMKTIGLPDSVAGDLNCPANMPTNKSCWFSALRLALGTDHYFGKAGDPSPGNYNYTSQQKEIVDAIVTSGKMRVASRLGYLIDELKEAQARRQAGPVPGVSSAEEDNLVDQLVPILGWLYQYYGVLPQNIINNKELSTSVVQTQDGGIDILRTANARVARADLMLKQLIDAVDQDIDRHFVQPTIEGLRKKLVAEKVISVGVANRTSMIASNRLLARVDARTTAQLPLGEEVNILQAVQQLAQVYQAAQTGNALGAFGSLNALSQKDAREIYGLNTQSQFKATPIFDPTGQTLRFQFDYVSANTVQEPNGSTNPQMPRIERHTVNTEVELNNLELREISRYNTNAKLGLAERRWGGIPLVKDIWGMSKIPLLGWFTRKTGSAAVVQQNLIFGQTTMYPTIGDMLELLSSNDYPIFLSSKKSAPCPQKVDPCKEPIREGERWVTIDAALKTAFFKNETFVKMNSAINAQKEK